jgi:hypothetical protein
VSREKDDDLFSETMIQRRAKYRMGDSVRQASEAVRTIGYKVRKLGVDIYAHQ